MTIKAHVKVKAWECDQTVDRVVSSCPPIGTGLTAEIRTLRTNPLACALFCQPVMDCVPDRRISIRLAICADTN